MSHSIGAITVTKDIWVCVEEIQMSCGWYSSAQKSKPKSYTTTNRVISTIATANSFLLLTTISSMKPNNLIRK